MVAGVVLAGGRSLRMGRSKPALEWHGSTLLRRVTGLVARAVEGPVVVVRAPQQQLPELPGVEVVADAHVGRGPLEGIAAGLGALHGRARIAYVSAADVPLLEPAFVLRVVAALHDEVDAAVPVLAGAPQPLAAAYRVTLAPTAERLLAQGERRARALGEACRTAWLDVDDADSLHSVDDPDAYAAARARPAPVVTLDGRPLHAATLGAAAGAALAGLTLNGRPVAPDPELPLVEGDALAYAPSTRSAPV